MRWFLLLLLLAPAVATADDRPNILWLTTEDIGPELGCYGDKYADTPNLDAFAKRSTLYLNAWSNAPVCAPARTTIISGMYASSLGAEHMRSLVPLPKGVQLYPTLMREAGYFCINPGKTDYNVEAPAKLWDRIGKDESPWPLLQQRQPFMAVLNNVGTHESQIRTRPHEWKHDPAKAVIPPYHPNAQETREDWAQYYDNITAMDAWFAEQLKQFDAAGLSDNTIVFFYGDHGSGMPRHKRSLQNSGLRVPLIVHIPEKFRSLLPTDTPIHGQAERLVGFVDLAPTILSLAGAAIPQTMQGVPFLGKIASPPQPYLYGFRGRMDERIDLLRTVRDERFHYIRHYMPHRVAGAHMAYMFETPTTRKWKALFDAGQLNPIQAAFWEPKPSEELYDLQSDPHETRNLVTSPEHQQQLKALRQAHLDHIMAIRDPGFLPEDELHSRAPGMAPYDLAHDPQKYPLPDVFKMAHEASMLLPDALNDLITGLSHPDSAVRYWAVMGILMRGPTAVSDTHEQLLEIMLNDPSPSVRTVAAEALGRFGYLEDRPQVLDWLLEAANGEKHGPYVSILALEAIDYMNEKAAPATDRIQKIPRKGPWQSPRNANYADRLIEEILIGLPSK
ncbi:sulfatase-like hydrolase/transferase [Planctomicrobium piriforme]|uniref:Uncharacterized sulfatase n=1 Tax=Planctomicrobium piriforme TaxID=1576369 RepID=A0A1I3C4W7_9PLAN|nr:sulfatase-like hydrolase/transferase [Planctomicrobium piriforme]SFH69584.1 uncharacterized sulfatase [Planctomicrobium piriforme]